MLTSVCVIDRLRHGCVIIFFMHIKNKFSYTKTALFLIIITYILNYNSFVELQLLSVFSLIPIATIPDTRSKYDRFIFYAFYPLHMLILVLLS